MAESSSSSSWICATPNWNFVEEVSAGWCIFAEVRVGNNSVLGGEPEYRLGRPGDLDDGQKTWDANISDGFDSGLVNVEFRIPVSGDTSGITLDIPTGTGQLRYPKLTYGYINKIQIEAAVNSNNMAMIWQNVEARFYRNGVVIETLQLPEPCHPVDDRINHTGNGTIIELVPNNSNCTAVVVTAKAKLASTSTTLPAAGAIFGRIYGFMANCVVS
jgi:hypothetical protein